MYAWLWARFPGGTPGKIACSGALTLAVVAVLFFWVFPWVEDNVPLLSSVTVDEAPEANPTPEPTAPDDTPSPSGVGTSP